MAGYQKTTFMFCPWRQKKTVEGFETEENSGRICLVDPDQAGDLRQGKSKCGPGVTSLKFSARNNENVNLWRLILICWTFSGSPGSFGILLQQNPCHCSWIVQIFGPWMQHPMLIESSHLAPSCLVVFLWVDPQGSNPSGDSHGSA